jgi:hypothetical protein
MYHDHTTCLKTSHGARNLGRTLGSESPDISCCRKSGLREKHADPLMEGPLALDSLLTHPDLHPRGQDGRGKYAETTRKRNAPGSPFVSNTFAVTQRPPFGTRSSLHRRSLDRGSSGWDRLRAAGQLSFGAHSDRAVRCALPQSSLAGTSPIADAPPSVSPTSRSRSLKKRASYPHPIQ